MASNPAVVACAKNTWVKVATGILSGVIYRLNVMPEVYVQTIRLTGGAAPTDLSDAAQIFVDGAKAAVVNSEASVDVYVMACGAAGSVRVDV
jgi:hypothetical protein